MNKKHQHGGPRKGAGRPQAQEKMHRRSIGMLEADWQKARVLADREGISVDEIIRRFINKIPNDTIVEFDTDFLTHHTRIGGVDVSIEKNGDVSFDVDGLRYFDLNYMELTRFLELVDRYVSAHRSPHSPASPVTDESL